MRNFNTIINVAQERKVEEIERPIEELTSQQSTLPLHQIRERETNTRELRQSHVEALAESIAVLGLLEPLVVDNRNRLLAGGHRLAAIKLLSEINPDSYNQHFPKEMVPVQVMPFDTETEPERAFQVEVAENEHRRDYTPAEVRALADRLRANGYVDQPGRPIKGTKALRPALEVIIGKSLRTVQRYLNEDGKPRHSAMVSEQTVLRQSLKKLQEWESMIVNSEMTAPRQELAKQLPKLMKLVELVIEEMKS